MNSAANVGVLGVRTGVLGTRSLLEVFEVPGRARPACSRCSVADSQNWPGKKEKEDK